MSAPHSSPPTTLVCFAVPQEARPFQKLIGPLANVRVMVTGMGSRNAERSIRRELVPKPALVLTCGFAGALDPNLQIGDIVFETSDITLKAQLLRSGAKSISFCSTARVVVTATEKSALRRATSADAVEMESAIIQSVCAAAGLPCATVRAISDRADEDLPLDFNSLLTADQRLNAFKLTVTILRSPRRIPALIRLGKNSAIAAEQLACVLQHIISDPAK
jgi:adenosylhomocysteine nucleosidase